MYCNRASNRLQPKNIATSGLDTQSEGIVQAALTEASQGKSRLNFVDHCILKLVLFSRSHSHCYRPPALNYQRRRHHIRVGVQSPIGAWYPS